MTCHRLALAFLLLILSFYCFPSVQAYLDFEVLTDVLPADLIIVKSVIIIEAPFL